MYRLNPNAKVIFNKDQVILGNIKTGAYIRTSKKYYEVLNKVILSNFDLEEINEKRDCDIVCKNIMDLYDSLCNIDFYIEESQVSEVLKDNLDVAYISVSNRCNLFCKHCFVSSDIMQKDILATSDIKSIIDTLVELNPTNINFTGGEPLLRKDIIEILNYAKEKYKGRIILSTNGLLIKESNVREIINSVDDISISIDGYDEKTCSNIRGEGVFQKVISSVKLLQRNKFKKISLSMLISSFTVSHEEEFNLLCKDLGVQSIIRNFTPSGRGENNCDEIFVVKEEIKSIEKDKLSCRLCSPGKKEIFINYDGDIYPCGALTYDKKFLMGSIFNDDLIKIMRQNNMQTNNEVIEELRPWNLEECKECNINLFCNNCISNIVNISNDKDIAKDFCASRRRLLEEVVWN